ncbi:MAG: hypothetical protein ACQKBY_12600 [Verrucomicrobiales bacterium]
MTAKFPLRPILCCLPLLALPACDGDKAPTAEAAPEAEKEMVWSWDNYRRSDELELGTMRADIQPKQSLEIKSEGTGVVTIEVEKRLTTVAKGHIWARMDVQELSEQERRLEIQEAQATLEAHRQESIDLPQKKREAREQLTEARRKVRVMEMILRSPAMQEMSAELFGGDIGDVNEDTLARAKQDLDVIEKNMAWLDKFEPKLRDDQEELKEMDLQKSKRSLTEAKDRSVYEIPFDGELRLELDYVDGQQEYTVTSRDVLATLNDYAEIHAYLTVANAKWINLDPKTLYLRLLDRDNTLMQFTDDRVEKDERTRKEERKYIFAVPLENNEGLKRLTGTQMQSELVAKLPTTAWILPKVDVSLYALGKTDTLDWGEMVDQLWPGAKVIAEGMKSLAVDYIPQATER